MKETEESVLADITNITNTYKESHFLRMRARKDHKDPNYKTAILVQSTVIPTTLDENVTADKLLEKVKDIPGHREIAKTGTLADTPQKRPLTVYTPGGTELGREKDYGFVIIYSNKQLVEAERNPPNLTNIKLQGILKESPPDFKKYQEIVVTKELVEKAQQSGAKRGTKGIPCQNTVMSEKGDKQEASATKIAKLLDLQTQPDEFFEWLHLIMFFLKLLAAQHPDNLTGGTKHANTDMMMGEDALLYIVDLLGGEIKLHVSTEEIGHHFSKEIRFTIETKYMTLPFVFNAQTSIQPSHRNVDYLHAVVDTIIEQIQTLFKPTTASAKKKLFPKDEKAPIQPAPKKASAAAKKTSPEDKENVSPPKKKGPAAAKKILSEDKENVSPPKKEVPVTVKNILSEKKENFTSAKNETKAVAKPSPPVIFWGKRPVEETQQEPKKVTKTDKPKPPGIKAT